MLKIAVCDDEPAQREYLASLVSRWADQKDTPVQISMFIHAEAFLFAYEDQKDFDILLLDIQMKEINGITLAETVRQERKEKEMNRHREEAEPHGKAYLRIAGGAKSVGTQKSGFFLRL